jgi:hypothetical protein
MVGDPPPNVALAVVAIVLAQSMRIEALRRPDSQGHSRSPIDRESLYTKAFRMLLSDMYAGFVNRQAEGTSLNMLLGRGLVSTYTMDEMLQEFKTWANSRTDSADLLNWARTVKSSKTQNNHDKAMSLVFRIIMDDIPIARELACRRASAIVVRRAF